MGDIMEKRQITFSPPDITEAEIEAVADTLRSGSQQVLNAKNSKKKLHSL